MVNTHKHTKENLYKGQFICWGSAAQGSMLLSTHAISALPRFFPPSNQLKLELAPYLTVAALGMRR